MPRKKIQDKQETPEMEEAKETDESETKTGKNKKNLQFLVILIVIIILLDVVFFLAYSSRNSPGSSATPSSSQADEDAIVTQVIDGSTFKLNNGQTIKLIGISSPAQGQQFSTESQGFLELLVKGKQVKLEKDTKDSDSSGNLLRYAYINFNDKDLLINSELVKLGYATPNPTEPNTKYKSEIAQALEECREAAMNLCAQ